MKNGNTFEGTFVDGKRHGHGVFHAPSGVSYDGMFKHGLKSGRGRVQNVNGSYYIGNFKNNRIEGSGLLQLKGEDEVENWHTQRFTRRNWPAGVARQRVSRPVSLFGSGREPTNGKHVVAVRGRDQRAGNVSESPL